MIKLLATRIVANSLLGLLRSEMTLFFEIEVSSLSSSSNDLTCNEKNATSAPDITAEKNNKMITSKVWIQNKSDFNIDR